MANSIGFFDMFADLHLPAALREGLVGCKILGATIDQQACVMDLELSMPRALDTVAQATLKSHIESFYGLSAVKLSVAVEAVTLENTPPKPSGSATVVSGGGGNSIGAGDVIFGEKIKGKKLTPMAEVTIESGTVIICGKVFAFECRETRRPGLWRMSFDLTDYTNSITVQKNISTKEAEKLQKGLSAGMWVQVQGRMEPTWDGKDVQLAPRNICKSPAPKREDKAEVKRVELHLHTKMSNMDALTDTKAVVKQAAAWGILPLPSPTMVWRNLSQMRGTPQGIK
ncbi:hypothetical protein RFF05_01595 [Bengtsoniella intestinalis]|uniref:hypothetical protein n=1 Tax=Bengtsoniella intestinalis TaxID=3073143 RepID=UPI00391FBE0C